MILEESGDLPGAEVEIMVDFAQSKLVQDVFQSALGKQ